MQSDAISRRTAISLLGGAGAFASAATSSRAAIRLEIGNYGMQSLAAERALALIREIGYDGAELCCMPGWPSEPARLDHEARRRIRDSGIPIPSLIEAFNLVAAESELRQVPGRIHAAAEFARDIAPDQPPLLQTVLGGKEDWAKVAGEAGIRLAVKAHAMNACNTPDKLVWLLDQVHHPALTAIYDYGHFQVVNLSIEKTMEQLLPRSALITVKDSAIVDGKIRFLLPGDGTINYRRYFGKVKEMGWHGWVLVEVTRQLQTEPGYDPAAAARRSFAHLAPILAEVGLR